MPDRHDPSLSLTSVKGDSKAASPLCFHVIPSSYASFDQIVDRACGNRRVVTAIEGLPSMWVIQETEPDCIEKLDNFRSFGNENRMETGAQVVRPEYGVLHIICGCCSLDTAAC